MIQVELERVEGDYGFRALDAKGNALQMDSSLENGGLEHGIRPMQTLLMALGGCSGIDIVSILKKQRQLIEGFRMKISGEREAGKEPSLWKTVAVHFELKGDIDEDKARKACALSIDKYCSVAETLRRAGTAITWTVQVQQTVHPQ
jgi:putative redox protein